MSENKKEKKGLFEQIKEYGKFISEEESKIAENSISKMKYYTWSTSKPNEKIPVPTGNQPAIQDFYFRPTLQEDKSKRRVPNKPTTPSEMFDTLYKSVKQKMVDEPVAQDQPPSTTTSTLPPHLLHMHSHSESGSIIFAYDTNIFCIKRPIDNEVKTFNLRNPNGKIELLEHLTKDLLNHPDLYSHVFRNVFGFVAPKFTTIQDIHVINGKLKFIFNNPIFQEDPQEEPEEEQNMIPGNPQMNEPGIITAWGNMQTVQAPHFEMDAVAADEDFEDFDNEDHEDWDDDIEDDEEQDHTQPENGANLPF